MWELTAAILSSLLFNVALVIQSLGTVRVPSGVEFGPQLLIHLQRQRVWLLGTLCVGVAYALELLALTALPLALVQPIIGGGVLVLPVAAFVLRRQPFSTPVILAALTVAAGVVLLGAVIPDRTGVTAAPGEALALVTAAAAAILYMAARQGRAPAIHCTVAGVAYGGTGLLSKLLAQHWSSSLVLVLACIIVLGAVGFLAEMTALKTVSPTSVGPIVLACLTILPVLGGRIFLNEMWPHPWFTLAGLCLTVTGGIWIARHVTVTAVPEFDVA